MTFLYRLAEVLRDYFKELEEESLREILLERKLEEAAMAERMEEDG